MATLTKTAPSLAGRVAIVTGGSDGIGYVTVLRLASRGARVYIMSRSSQKAEDAIEAMKRSQPDNPLDVHFLRIDLQSLSSVQEAAQKFKAKESRLDILVNNAGIMATPYALTGDGFEQQWQTNYLSPFFLIKALLPVLSFTAAEARPRGDVRIVNVSSDAAFVSLAPNPDVEDPNLGYLKGMMAAWKRYCHSKLALVLLTHRLHTTFQTQNLAIKAYVIHPGVAETNLQASDPTFVGKTVKFLVRWGLVPGKLSREDAAKTALACATSDDK
ncbi:MAG: hypothetical protein Q9190_003630 [Brigantiaea leucoxantha]